MAPLNPHDPRVRLASYGSLAPGRENHGQVSGLAGHWRMGTVRGRLVEGGWGSALGYPGLVLDPEGREVEVFVLESAELPAHWARVDEFEGESYRRVETRVAMRDNGEALSAYIYEYDQSAANSS